MLCGVAQDFPHLLDEHAGQEVQARILAAGNLVDECLAGRDILAGVDVLHALLQVVHQEALNLLPLRLGGTTSLDWGQTGLGTVEVPAAPASVAIPPECIFQVLCP